MTLPISINDEAFVLHCSGALFWPNKNMLLISDVHLGKVTHFRKHGVALPQHSVAGNFKQLDFAVSMFGPEKICFLGDLFHSVINSEWELFEKWVGQTD